MSFYISETFVENGLTVTKRNQKKYPQGNDEKTEFLQDQILYNSQNQSTNITLENVFKSAIRASSIL